MPRFSGLATISLDNEAQKDFRPFRHKSLTRTVELRVIQPAIFNETLNVRPSATLSVSSVPVQRLGDRGAF
jgi:hypothetical protein